MDRKSERKGNNAYGFSDPRTGMRICLIISLLFHVCLLIVINKAFPISWMIMPLRTYHVELLRPPVDPLNEEKQAITDLSGANPDKKTLPEDTEDTISLDTKDKRYISYAGIIKERLIRHWEYPAKARKNLIEGQILVIFSLNRQGDLTSVKILSPSVHSILDDEATRAIRAAAPFPSFPGSVTVQKLNIKANFTYKLTARK